MFYCKADQIKNQWPESIIASVGTCEVCGRVAVCFDTPSKFLSPIPQENDMNEDAARSTLGQPSITHPEAEAANKHLSWTDEGVAQHNADLDGRVSDESDTGEPIEHTYSSYAGAPDGSWTITVTIDRGYAIATQSEAGSGEKKHELREATQKAYEKADRAINLLRAAEPIIP